MITTFLGCFCLAASGNGQAIPERAFYPVAYFSPSEFEGHPQSWDVEGDNDGVVYVANSGGHTGLIRFDGLTWSQYPLANQSAAFSLAVGKGDTVYVGGQSEIGFFASNEHQEYVYHSYLEQLPDTSQSFSNVWFTHKTDDVILYNTQDHLFLFRSNQPVHTFTGEGFGFSFVHDDTVWVKRKGGFYKVLVGENEVSFESVPGTESLAEQLTYAAFALNDSTLIFSQRGFSPFAYSITRQELYPFETSMDEQLQDDWIYGGMALQNGGFLLHSVSHGVYLFSEEGRLLETINRTDGLYNQEVYAAWEDNQQNIWLALNNGLAVARPFSPLKTFWEGYGFSGGVEDILEVEGSLFISTQQGVYRVDNLYENSPVFTRISGEPAQHFDILQFGDQLLVAGANEGLLLHNHSRGTTETLVNLHSEFITKLPGETDALIGAGRNGIYLLRKDNRTWNLEWQIDDQGVHFRNMMVSPVTDNSDQLLIYAGTTSGGLYHLRLDADQLSVVQSLRKVTMAPDSTLPPGPVEVYRLSDRLLLGTTSGLFDLWEHPDGTVSVNPNQLMTLVSTSKSNRPFRVFENRDKNRVWIGADDDLFSFETAGGDMSLNFPDILQEIQIGDIHTVMEDKQGVLWLGGMDGLARYFPDEHSGAEGTGSFHKTYIRVQTARSDSILADKYRMPEHPVELPFRENSLEFSFSSNFYHPNFKPLFAWQLEGLHSEYSDFSETHKASVQNLSPGSYTLRVISQNSLGAPTEQAVFEFLILRPWYSRWWFILIYIAVGLAGVAGLVYLRSYNLKKKKDELEVLVEQRTEEVVEQKEQIEDLVTELKRMDALKSRHFANISHELRTPLTLMLNPLDDLLKTTDTELPGNWKDKLEIASKNTRRLKKLVDEILDLIKLESGMLEVQPQKVELIRKTRQIVSMYESLAEVKQIALSYRSDFKNPVAVMLDSGKYEHIVNNLVSNAIKFTPQNGNVTVELFYKKEVLELVVSDSGIGIEQDDLPHIFNRFYKAGQADNNNEGMGIGLALSQQLARLMGGDLKVTSQIGTGSVFTLTLPTQKTDSTPIVADPDRSETSDEPTLEADEPEPLTNPGKPHLETILVVEDNTDMQHYLTLILEPKYRVELALSGKEGLQKLEKTSCSLVISDIMMPEMDGLTFAHEVRKQNRYQNIPIIFLSARADIGFRLEGLRTGVEDYLVKPFNNEELCVRVENLLRNRRRILQALEQGVEEKDAETTLSESDQFLEQTRQIIHTHIDEADFNVTQLAAKMYHSERQLNRKLQSLTGYTPAEYIKQIRLQYARSLIEQKKYATVSEIARAVGYSKPAYFSTLYKKAFGSSPSSHF